ncbi:serine aminopeptidase domain-containing protein [Dyadobacter sp. CY312]|uniref:alpha/beta hydrolase family protein n=1 Tax=Dyadobacter sp. CY312 TaxID=2907303 RepID=UPI001F469293|nr:alpha/beta hydrolase [Dyadobacter sp. CY312]MCE7043868.1 alpha/beta hydrolase [Dyadobacter sp. CY312]
MIKFVKKSKGERLVYALLSLVLLAGCGSSKKMSESSRGKRIFNVQLDSTNIFDVARNRKIPVAFYSPKTRQGALKQKLVIFSHGYGENKGGDNLIYSYLTENLASKGYFVVSIQHELTTDSLLAMTGILRATRLSNWERGAENIRYVIKTLKDTKPDLDFRHIILMGHSNGGDMTALFATKYPDEVDRMVTLDNRRMPLPRTKKVKVLSLRSSDMPADEGVLPTEVERREFGMKVYRLSNTKHSEMDNDATEIQRKEINEYIIKFLEK